MKTPNLIDKHVGSRLRMRRIMLGMSQEKLAVGFGLTFQQVQKYEKGVNRMGASRLQQAAQILDVSVPFFFEGAPGGHKLGEGAPSTAYVDEFVSSPEGLRLVKAFMRIARPGVRHRSSLTDPDARSMATSGRGSGVVGYNVQVAVDTTHHLIITHEVTNVGTDRSQLSSVAKQAKATLQAEDLNAIADRGYFSSDEILACENAGITVTLPKPMTSGIIAKGRFGKQDFRYVAEEDIYIYPAGETLVYHYTNEEHGLVLRRFWTNACQSCAIKQTCTSGKERRITRWEHEHILEGVQRRLDEHPEKMRQRRETVEHPFGAIKARMGATHFLMKTLPRVAAEVALHVLAYNMTRVMNIMGVRRLLEAMRA